MTSAQKLHDIWSLLTKGAPFPLHLRHATDAQRAALLDKLRNAFIAFYEDITDDDETAMHQDDRPPAVSAAYAAATTSENRMRNVWALLMPKNFDTASERGHDGAMYTLAVEMRDHLAK